MSTGFSPALRSAIRQDADDGIPGQLQRHLVERQNGAVRVSVYCLTF